MKIYNLNNCAEFLDRINARSDTGVKEAEETAAEIIEDVRINGDEAVRKYTAKFDSDSAKYYEVPAGVIEKAYREADSELINALKRCKENIEAFHERQKQDGYVITSENGVMLGQRSRGLERAGIYVPGGSAPLVSSVLMCAVPAKIAGVGEIIMTTPPQKDGTPNMDILAAARLCGVDKVFQCGGAQAIAAMAFGTENIPRVCKIVGPGNIYVTAAKRLLFGTVDIDMLAGPSEILILADESANPRYIAADLLSQAEHDRLSSAVLITTSNEIAKTTVVELERQLAALPRKEIAEESLQKYGAIIVADSKEQAVDLANKLAPEHLEVLFENPLEYIGRINNAASVFFGAYSPEPLGDYYAGSNHVLPTNGTARFFSPLSVETFTKKSSWIYYTKDALKEAADATILIAEREGLDAHANSVKVRCEN
ncbi:MAG: histidinol dehydrogenase [Oscillospiraceae bacterium]|jgi:histidinol dehydrogenase|nr:histidinol dehydrogenase [Oscillospiraceae bacterium]